MVTTESASSGPEVILICMGKQAERMKALLLGESRTVTVATADLAKGKALQDALKKAVEDADANGQALVAAYKEFRSRVAKETKAHGNAVAKAVSALRGWMEKTQEKHDVHDPSGTPWEEAYYALDEIRGIDPENALYDLSPVNDVARTLRVDREHLVAATAPLTSSWDEPTDDD